MKRDLEACHLFAEYGGRSGSNSWWVQAPGRQHWPKVGRTLDQPREGEFVSLEDQLIGSSAELSRGELCIRYEVGQDNV